MSRPVSPTVVLVHGAFADASSYAGVIPELTAAGLEVVAPAVPNRSLVDDAAYSASVVRAIPGPVILVGALLRRRRHHRRRHGGQRPGTGLPVRIRVGGGREPRRAARTAGLADALVYTPFPVAGSDETGTDVSVEAERFPALFAEDADPEFAAVLAVSQRPLAARAFTETAPAAAWKSRPSWGLIATSDRTINPDVERYGYERAGMTTIEVDSSHLVMLAQPKRVAELIQDAVRSTAH